jgi:hypothetical protein
MARWIAGLVSAPAHWVRSLWRQGMESVSWISADKRGAHMSKAPSRRVVGNISQRSLERDALDPGDQGSAKLSDSKVTRQPRLIRTIDIDQRRLH